MPARKMHADELDIDDALVRRLIAARFPRWAGLPLARVEPSGTDNAIYRLGRDLAVRLPRRAINVPALQKERRWLPAIAPRLPLPVPVPLAAGAPTEGYPFPWSVCRWVEGEPATPDRVRDPRAAAADLAGFILALRRIDPRGGPAPGRHNSFRGVPLTERDEPVRAAIASLGPSIDAAAVTAVWESALAAPPWDAAPVWIHGDLDGRNLLARDGRLGGVVDFGCLGVGDPACDVMVAWKLFSAGSRAAFRDALGVDDATWARARGWAVSQAVIALGYYTEETNPVLVGEARRWLAETLADAG